MQRSIDRTLTMHAGSLARPPDLRGMVLAKSHGQPSDALRIEALNYALRDIPEESVRRVWVYQCHAGSACRFRTLANFS